MATGGGDVAHSSQDFAQQIKQLEEEGNKLMASAQILQTSLAGPYMPQRSSQVGSPSHTKGLSALTDITDDQHTISHLRENLDATNRETEGLRQQLRGSHPVPYSSPLTSRYNPSLLSSLEIPHQIYQPSAPVSYSNLSGSHAYPVTQFDTLHYEGPASTSQNERELRQAQEEAADLRTKVREAIRIAEQQKNQFRTAIDDLKTQLQHAVRDRDIALQAKSKDTSHYEATMQKQQSNIQQLQEANKIQEETLVEMNGKLETLQRDHYAMDTLLAQVRSIILDQEHKRGRPYYETEPTLRQSPTKLAHSLERCLHELEQDLSDKTRRLVDITAEFEDHKVTWQERHQIMSQEQQDRLGQQNAEHERELQAATERLVATRKQVAVLQEQIASLQQEKGHSLREKEEQMRELQECLDKVTKDGQKEVNTWKDKCTALEGALDQVQREIASTKSERDEAVKKMNHTEAKFEELKDIKRRLEFELETEREQVRKLTVRDADAGKELEMLQQQLQSRTREAETLKQTITSVKLECDQHIQNSLKTMSDDHLEKNSQRLQDMSRQVAEVTEKYQEARLQLEVLRAEHKNLNEQYSQRTKQLTDNVSRLEELKVIKEQLTSSLQERLSDIERLTQEKDTYFKLLGEKDVELLKVRGEVDKLTLQYEDKVVQLHSLTEQHSKLLELSRSQEQQGRSSQEQLDRLSNQLHQLGLERQELANSRDNIAKRLKLREKHLKDLEEDNRQLSTQVSEYKQEVKVLKRERSQCEEELTAAKHELNEQMANCTKLEKTLQHNHETHKKEVKKLAAKLQATEHEVKLTQKALKSQKDVDDRAVKVAGKMQKEVTEKRSLVDSLNSKISWLQESLDAAIKSKKLAREQVEKVTEKLSKTEEQRETLKREIEETSRQNLLLRDKVSKLDAALEKAAVKHAETQAQLEHFQQDVARLKLKHQLDLKEHSRNGPVKYVDFKTVVPPASRSPAVTSRQGTHEQSSKDNLSEADNKEIPVKQVQNYMTEQVVGEELRMLLEQMRELLSGQQLLQLQPQKQQQRRQLPKEPNSTKDRRKSSRRRQEKKQRPGEANYEDLSDSDANNYYNNAHQHSKQSRKHEHKGNSNGSSKQEFVPDDRILNSQSKPAAALTDDDSVSEIVADRQPQNPELLIPVKTNTEILEEKIANFFKTGSHIHRETQDVHNLKTIDDKKIEKQYNSSLAKS